VLASKSRNADDGLYFYLLSQSARKALGYSSDYTNAGCLIQLKPLRLFWRLKGSGLASIMPVLPGSIPTRRMFFLPFSKRSSSCGGEYAGCESQLHQYLFTCGVPYEFELVESLATEGVLESPGALSQPDTVMRLGCDVGRSTTQSRY